MGPGFLPQGSSNTLAIAALICGILSLPVACCCSGLSLPLGIAAAVMGGIAISKANAQPALYEGKGLAIGGLVCGLVSIVLSIVLLAIGMGQVLVDQYQHH